MCSENIGRFKGEENFLNSVCFIKSLTLFCKHIELNTRRIFLLFIEGHREMSDIGYIRAMYDKRKNIHKP